MRFYKLCGRNHPSHKLPTVQWRNGAPLFEFTKTDVPNVLGFDTDDPELQDLLTAAGYVTDKPESPNIRGMALMHPVQPGEPHYEEIKAVERRNTRRK